MFHGCNGSAEPFASNYGYNEFAATNDMIMVYPDSRCWYPTVPDKMADTKEGMMPMAIMKMVDRVTAANSDDEDLAEAIAQTITAFFQ